MPKSKASKNGAEEMHRLQEELRRKDAKIAALEREKAAALAAKKPINLIPRPKGQAGRSSGYNLQEAMKLDEDSERYNRLYRIVKDFCHDHLSVKETISAQNKRRLETTIALIAKAAPYFSKFEGYWPVHEMIAGYLLNAQTRRRKDLRLEQLADGADTGEEGDDEMTVSGNVYTEEEEMGPVVKRRGSRKVSFRVDPDSDTDMELHPPSPKKVEYATKTKPESFFDNIHATIVADENLFDPYNETSNLIELKDFIAFILTPFVAALLIAQDMDIPVDQAHDIRDNSNEFGDIMQPDEDGEGGVLDDLHRANIRAMKGTANAFFAHPPRHRKQGVDPPPADAKREINKGKVQSKTGRKSSKGTITLDDFPEPGSKKSTAKNPAAKANKATKKDKTPAKTNTIKSDYGTRSRTGVS
ncbi:hypothetical protein B0H13DRAFT_2373356 [Mycena leptocephala]|nr:hypothetical protein B0H13DRAFT_2373356 [Mycena leptocephala]